MRTIKIYLLLFFTTVNLTQTFAQVTWEYGNIMFKAAYEGKSLEALSSIRLLPGFEVSSGTTFSAKIQYLLVPNAPNLSQLNYTKTTVLLKEGKKSQSDVILTPAGDKMVSYEYQDGFGRSIQQVDVGASPAGFDLVQHFAYDKYGQQSTQYLPYVSNTQNGSYQLDALSKQLDFYNSSGDKIANDTKPYSTSKYNDSPIAQLLEQGAPGADWQTGSGHSITTAFGLNKSTDGVMKASAEGFSGTYLPGTLNVNKITDENGNHVLQFYDKIGRMLLKRVQLDENMTENGSTSYVPYLETYYIYDDYNRLIYQVPPKATAKLKNGATWNASFIDEWLYEYKYDAKGRLIAKNLPDAGAVFICYNTLDQPVLVQDARLRTSGKWFYSKYDNKRRVISEGIYQYTDLGTTGSTTQEKLQNYLDAIDYTSSFYDEEKESATDYGYSNRVFPTTGIDALRVYYYDGYDFNADGIDDYTYTAQSLTGEKVNPKGNAFDLPTGMKKRIMGTSNWIVSYTFYDHDGRSIQLRGNNHLSASVDNLQTTVYNFAGQPTISKSSIKGSNNAVINVLNKLEYLHHGRLSKIYQSNNASADQLIAQYEYNELGQLVDKKLHATASAFLQSIDYRYNIRGWLTHINNSSLSTDENNDESNDLFGMEFLYNNVQVGLNDQSGDKRNWNGAISAVKWKTQSNDTYATSSGNTVRERSYKFSYDKVDRLLSASYQAFSGTAWTAESGGYNESATYDHNGNILSLKRYHLADQSSSRTLIDDLTYHYASGFGNQLKKVTDLSTNQTGFKDGANSSDEYGYDAGGSLERDDNKGITQISYNDLGKAEIVYFTDGKKIVYDYDGTGVRIRKKIYAAGNSTPVKITDYIGGFVYEDGNLAYFSMPEGRVREVAGSFIYEYFIRDNQGNVRISFEAWNNGTTTVAKLVQENHYYPFGMSMQGMAISIAHPSSANKNLYNGGSELQDDFADEPNWYSMLYRDYDPVLGRMNGVDPMADKYASWSPFNYAFNNPVNINDPNGADPFTTQQEVDDFINKGLNSKYGAHWDAENGPSQIVYKNGQYGYYDLTVETRVYEEGREFRTEFLLTDKFVPLNNRNQLAFPEDLNSGNKEVGVTGWLDNLQADWYDIGSKINATLGAVTPFVKSSIGYMRAGAISLKYYASGWAGGSRGLVKTVKLARIGGVVGFAAGEIMDGIALSEGKIGLGKAGLNLGMGILGLYGGKYGTAVSAIYFGVDSFYNKGWSGVWNDISNSSNKTLDTEMQDISKYHNSRAWQ